MYCVLNMGWTPSQYINLSQRERAFIIASIQLKIEEEKKQMAGATRSSANIRKRR